MVFANNAIYCDSRTAIDAAGLDTAAVSSNIVSGRLIGAGLDGRRFLAGGTLEKAFWSAVDLRPRAGSSLAGRADTAYAPEYDFEGNRRGEPFDIGALLMSPPTAQRPLLQEGFKTSIPVELRRKVQ